MEGNNTTLHGSAGLKKNKISPIGISFMIFSMVCAGAFGVEEMIPNSGPGLTVLLLVVFPFVWAFPISNMMAECGALLPREGGLYAWTKEAYGEFWGFCAGWWNTMAIYITNGIYVVLAVGYAGQYIPMSPAGEMAAKIGMVAIFTIVNLMGLKEVSILNTIFSVSVMSAFVLVAIVGFLNWDANPVDPFIPPEVPFQAALSGGLALAIWMYCGYESVAILAGEVQNAKKVIPKGMLIAMPLIAGTYVLPTVAGLGSLGEGNWANWTTDVGMEGSGVGYSAVLSTHLGEAWGYVFMFVAIIGQCALFNTYIAAGSRGFFVMGEDNLFPKFMTKISKKRQVPFVGILTVAAVTAVLMNFEFQTIILMEVLFVLGMYLMLPFVLIKLRKLYPVADRQKEDIFVMPGGKFGLVAFTSMPIIIAVAALYLNGTDYLLMGIGGLYTAIIAYVSFKLLYGGLSKSDPVKYPLDPKTKLTKGDVARIGFLFAITGALALIGSFFLPIYEGSWGPEYYAEENTGVFADFYFMINALRWGGAAAFALGLTMFTLDKKNMQHGKE